MLYDLAKVNMNLRNCQDNFDKFSEKLNKVCKNPDSSLILAILKHLENIKCFRLLELQRLVRPIKLQIRLKKIWF